MVEGIQALGSKLRLHLLGDTEILDGREIPPRLPVGADRAETQRREPYIAPQLLGAILVETGIRVEPPVDIPLALRQHDIGGIAREQRKYVAKTERGSALPLHDAVPLPAAGQEIQNARHTVAESASAADR